MEAEVTWIIAARLDNNNLNCRKGGWPRYSECWELLNCQWLRWNSKNPKKIFPYILSERSKQSNSVKRSAAAFLFRMKKFKEICLVILLLAVLAMIQSVSGKSREFLMLRCFTSKCQKSDFPRNLIFFYLALSKALRCFSCSVTSQTSDTKCLTDPISVEGQSVVNCNKKYCTILRQELKVTGFTLRIHTRGARC